MKGRLKTAGVVVLFCVPWAFLAPWWDAAQGGMLGYLVMLLGLGILDRLSLRGRQIWLGAAGNLISAAVSLCFAKGFLGEEWNYYFKPLTAFQLTAGLSAAAVILYFLAARSHGRKK